jgi:hypothetical protein
MSRGFDIFAVVVALVTLAVVFVSRRRALPPAWRGWQLGLLCLVGGHGLHGAVRLLSQSPSLVQAAALTRLVLLVPALWLMWRHRQAVSGPPCSGV